MTQEPLGLPKGSVRAIIALMVIGATVALAALGRPIPDPISQIAALVAGIYFGQRAANGGNGG